MGKRTHGPAKDAQERKVAALEAKLQQKNKVIAELRQEHVQLKKAIGEPYPGNRS